MTFTFTPSDGSDPMSDSSNVVKPAPHSGGLTDCTIDTSSSGPEGTLTISGSVRLHFSGAH